MNFTPATWYYSVRDHNPTTQVYSTASMSYVILADATYVAWLAAGEQATPIDTEVNLFASFDHYARSLLTRPALKDLTGGNTPANGSTTQLVNPLAPIIFVELPGTTETILKLPPTRRPDAFPMGAILRVVVEKDSVASCALGIRTYDNTILAGAGGLTPALARNEFRDFVLTDNKGGTSGGTWQIMSFLQVGQVSQPAADMSV
jgi:hypothetical protein